MAERAILTEGTDYITSDVEPIHVTPTGLYRIMETHASVAWAVIENDEVLMVKFEPAAGGV
jgi:hypothetical protein